MAYGAMEESALSDLPAEIAALTCPRPTKGTFLLLPVCPQLLLLPVCPQLFALKVEDCTARALKSEDVANGSKHLAAVATGLFRWYLRRVSCSFSALAFNCVSAYHAAHVEVCTTVCLSQLFACLNCSPSTTVCPQLFALN